MRWRRTLVNGKPIAVEVEAVRCPLHAES
jgi:hypothetical protein